jgi:aminoacyl-tRNA hydrolase
MFLDYFKEKYNFSEFKLEKKFKAEISEWTFPPSIKGDAWKAGGSYKEKIILSKPQTFMNLSWEAVIQILNFYKIKKEDLIIISDDISMEFSKIRFREKWSAWWHNWLKSIIEHIWEEFKRIKVWVWNNSNYETSDWVLSKFQKKELEKLNEVFQNVEKLLQKYYFEV